MFYYYKKTGDHIDILGMILDENSIPSNCSLCTEEEYNQYQNLMDIQKYGTLQQRELKRTIESIKLIRKNLLNAFDIYKSNVIYGIITETTEEKKEILQWYQDWLNLPNTITIDNYTNIVYPTTPINILPYIN